MDPLASISAMEDKMAIDVSHIVGSDQSSVASDSDDNTANDMAIPADAEPDSDSEPEGVCHFFKLPIELRQEVYGYLSLDKYTLNLNTGTVAYEEDEDETVEASPIAALALSCKQLRNEVLSLLPSTLSIDYDDDYEQFDEGDDDKIPHSHLSQGGFSYEVDDMLHDNNASHFYRAKLRFVTCDYEDEENRVYPEEPAQAGGTIEISINQRIGANNTINIDGDYWIRETKRERVNDTNENSEWRIINALEERLTKRIVRRSRQFFILADCRIVLDAMEESLDEMCEITEEMEERRDEIEAGFA